MRIVQCLLPHRSNRRVGVSRAICFVFTNRKKVSRKSNRTGEERPVDNFARGLQARGFSSEPHQEAIGEVERGGGGGGGGDLRSDLSTLALMSRLKIT